MAQIDKIQVQGTTYDVAQSASASFTGTSSDTTKTPSDYTDSALLGSTETNSSIFSKISQMFSNIRWMYNKLGTTDISGLSTTVTGAISALNTNKLNTSAVVNQQSTSTSTVPTSALVSSMNDQITSLNDAFYDQTVYRWYSIHAHGELYCASRFRDDRFYRLTLNSNGQLSIGKFTGTTISGTFMNNLYVLGSSDPNPND